METHLPRLRLARLVVAAGLLAAGCSPAPEATSAEPSSPEPDPKAAPERPLGRPSPVPDEGPLVVFLGDSLTAGLGIGEAEAFPEQVRRLLATEGIAVRIVNAGVSINGNRSRHRSGR